MAHLWSAAGRPSYMRSPRRDLVGPDMYALLVEPSLLDLAEDLLGTDELSVHGIFNVRPKCRISAGPIRPGTRTRNIIATQKKCTC